MAVDQNYSFDLVATDIAKNNTINQYYDFSLPLITVAPPGNYISKVYFNGSWQIVPSKVYYNGSWQAVRGKVYFNGSWQ